VTVDSCTLGENRYGKSRIRMVRVRRGERHELWDLRVDVALSGDFLAAHRDGDNAAVLPTDTMKNTVYALANDEPSSDIERFGVILARHFLAQAHAASRAEIKLTERPWSRVESEGRPHRHTFTPGAGGTRVAWVAEQRGGKLEVESGIADLILLKTTDSAFVDFQRDRYTTLRDAPDRIFATSVNARWRYGAADGSDLDFSAVWRAIHAALGSTFAAHKSASVQHTLYAMGEAALAARPELASIHLALPNLHHFLVDLSPFGLDNRDQIYVATDEPHGLIEATLHRK
jgi:urate oxidase